MSDSPTPADTDTDTDTDTDADTSAGTDTPDASASPSRRRRRWLRRLGIAAVILLILYTGVGFLVVPHVITSVLPPRISARLAGDLTITEATFNPFTFTTTITGVQVTDADGTPAAGFARFEGHLDLIDTLTSPGLHVHHARLFEPMVDARRNDAGVLNLSQLVLPPAEPATPGEPLRTIPRIVITDLLVADASARFEDQAIQPPFQRSISNLDFSVDVLDTDPTHRNEHALDARIGDAAAIDWRGTTLVDPLTSEGVLTVDGLQLAPFAPYVRQLADLAVEDGRLSLRLEYTFAPVDMGQRLEITSTRIVVEDLRTLTADRPLLAFRSLELDGIGASADGRSVEVDRILLDGLQTTVRRRADGTLEPLALRPSGDGSSAPESGETSADVVASPESRDPRVDPASIEYPIVQLTTAIQHLVEDLAADWSVAVADVTLTDGEIDVEDAAAREPVSLALRDLALAAGPISSADGFRTPFDLSLTVAGGGSITLAGDVSPRERSATIDVGVDGLALDALAAYLPEQLPAPYAGTRFDGALLAIDGRAVASVGDDGMQADWQGRFGLTDLRTSGEGDASPVQLGTLDSDGQLLLSRGAEGLRAEWQGRFGLADLRTTGGDLSAPAQLGALDTDGRLLVTNGTDGLRADWQGRFGLASLQASGGPLSDPARLSGLETDGRLVVTAGAEGGLQGATWSGDASLSELAADVTVEERPQSLQVGSFRTAGDLELTMTDGAPSVRWTGELGGRGVDASGGAAAGEGRLDLEELSLTAANLAWSPDDRSLQAETLSLAGPRIQATLLAGAASAEPESGDAGDSDDAGETTAGTVTLPLALQLGHLSITNGTFALEDRRTDTPLTIAGDGLTLDARSIDSAGGTPIDLTLRSGVSDVGVVSVAGAVDPFLRLLSADLEIDVTDMPLRPFGPVATPALGYAIDSGRLTLSLPITVKEGVLDGRVDARLDNFYLGEKVPSQSAPDLPLKLALALLRDPDDSISAELGIKGDTTRPGFSLGETIWNAALSLVGNVATSPFKLIAGLFGEADTADLSEVRFEPGATTLTDGAARDLDLLSRGLKERPALGLIVVGLTGPSDVAPLRQQALARAIDERRAAGAGDDAAALIALFDERFPGERPIPVPVPPGRLDQERLSPETMRERLLDTVTVDPEVLTQLAASRAERVRVILVEQNGIDASRVRVPDPEQAAQARDLEEGPRVAFELTTRDG